MGIETIDDVAGALYEPSSPSPAFPPCGQRCGLIRNATDRARGNGETPFLTPVVCDYLKDDSYRRLQYGLMQKPERGDMTKKRKLFDALTEGVDTMRRQREGKITFRSHEVKDLPRWKWTLN
jgi:hypothetical protein